MAKTDLTDERRERVRELFGKSDRRIAEILIEEGFYGPTRRTKEAKSVQIATARRGVARDREWWRQAWKDEKRAIADAPSRGEFIARLRTRIEDLEEMLDDPSTKSTPRVQALAEIRMLEQAIAKAQGIDEDAAKTGEDAASNLPFVGLVLGVAKVSAATLEKGAELSRPSVKKSDESRD